MTPDEIRAALKAKGYNLNKVAVKVGDYFKGPFKVKAHEASGQDVSVTVEGMYLSYPIRLRICNLLNMGYFTIWGSKAKNDKLKFDKDHTAVKGMQPPEITKLIQESALTITRLAHECGFSKSYVGFIIERRRYNKEIQESIAKALGIKFNDIWG